MSKIRITATEKRFAYLTKFPKPTKIDNTSKFLGSRFSTYSLRKIRERRSIGMYSVSLCKKEKFFKNVGERIKVRV
jgi:hypothetical protein